MRRLALPALLLLPLSARPADPLAPGRHQGARHPAVLGRRLERLPADGTWCDLHAADGLPGRGAYLRPRAFPRECRGAPPPRAGAYTDLQARVLPWGPPRGR